MKKTLKYIFTVLTIAIVSTIIAHAQTTTSTGSTSSSSILSWITGIGVPGILAFAFGLWKKGPTLIGKIATFVMEILDSLGNLSVQVAEARTALNTDFQKLKQYTADGNLDANEIQDLIKTVESSLSEFNDVPAAIKQLKDDFKKAVAEFKGAA